MALAGCIINDWICLMGMGIDARSYQDLRNEWFYYTFCTERWIMFPEKRTKNYTSRQELSTLVTAKYEMWMTFLKV